MKIAITSKGRNKTDAVDPRFGRAAYFIIIDQESGKYEAIDNSAGVQAGGGAGVSAGETLSQKGVGALLTGHCGPKAFQILKAAEIAVYTGAEGTVAEAMERFQSGDWAPTEGPDVQSHWR